MTLQEGGAETVELTVLDRTKYTEYEELLLERDQAEKEAGQIYTVYIAQFGQLLIDIFNEKIECIKLKKTIGYYQEYLNRGQPIDYEAIAEFIDGEMASYNSQLQSMIEENRACKEAGFSSEYEVRRSKEIYRKIAKLIHPDINPETDKDPQLQDLWNQAAEAYHRNDIKRLSEVEILARKALSESGKGDFHIEIPDMEDRIKELKAEIEAIRNKEPYTLGVYVNDPAAKERRKAELSQELASYQKYRKELDSVISELLKSEKGGSKWRMN